MQQLPLHFLKMNNFCSTSISNYSSPDYTGADVYKLDRSMLLIQQG